MPGVPACEWAQAVGESRNRSKTLLAAQTLQTPQAVKAGQSRQSKAVLPISCQLRSCERVFQGRHSSRVGASGSSYIKRQEVRFVTAQVACAMPLLGVLPISTSERVGEGGREGGRERERERERERQRGREREGEREGGGGRVGGGKGGGRERERARARASEREGPATRSWTNTCLPETYIHGAATLGRHVPRVREASAVPPCTTQASPPSSPLV